MLKHNNICLIATYTDLSNHEAGHHSRSKYTVSLGLMKEINKITTHKLLLSLKLTT